MRQSRRGCRNSQAKGPVLDGTLESRKAPKKQSGYRRIFQVSDRGMDRYQKYLFVPLFLFIKVNAMYLHNCFDDHESVDKTCVACFINYQNRGQKTILNRKEEKDENRH